MRDHPTLVAERNARIADHCAHVPSWWQFLKRRWWWRMLRALQAIDVSEWTWHLRQLYPRAERMRQQHSPDLVESVAQHPLLRAITKIPSAGKSFVRPVVYESDDENGGQS